MVERVRHGVKPTQQFLGGKVTLYQGDCLDVLDTFAENSVDSCVCDPPYHLQSIVKRFAKVGRTDKTWSRSGPHQRTAAGFMNKMWDGGDIAFRVETWEKIYRVLKPGAYLIAFSSTRTFGRMSVAIEDTGFIVHPFIAWIFGQGFPKAHRVEHEDWEGWRYGTQSLKPAIEPIFVGQKPFDVGLTGTANVLKWGTGALNIDGCRVATEDYLQSGAQKLWSHYSDGKESKFHNQSLGRRPGGFGNVGAPKGDSRPNGYTPIGGRWPANIIHDGSDEIVGAFPETISGTFSGHRNEPKTKGVYGKFDLQDEHGHVGDSGNAARFFYAAKADADDRLGSKHPTVKPVDLIAYLIRLVTPKGGTVLDPFAGTGTTGAAAYRERKRVILIEREDEYCTDIARRMRHEHNRAGFLV